jgi:hypothetical protein
MNTNLRFPLPRHEELKKQVRPLVTPLVNRHVAAAVEAVTEAFSNADYQAGNGLNSYGTSSNDYYFAEANVETGEFRLFANVEK